MWNSSNDWYFERGPTDGFNDSGISNFKDMKYDGLAREIIQNSLDAKDSTIDMPVEVVFEKKDFDVNLFPSFKSFTNSVDKCIDFISDQKDNSSSDALNEIKTTLIDYENNGSFPVLVVSDYNTIGLSGYMARNGSSWSDLLKIHGNNNKSSGSGGSYGIGKFAPFVFSGLRTIVYSSKNNTEGIAVQGKTILSGHIDGEKKTPRGYYGELKRVDISQSCSDLESFPFTNTKSIPSEFVRERNGTSLYILGANFNDNWFDEIMLSVIVSFFYAILDKKLKVIIKDTSRTLSIDDSSISSIVKDNYDKYSNRKDFIQTCSYIKILNNDGLVSTFDKDFKLIDGSIGKMSLKLICDEEIPLKSIAHIRNSGMKIENSKSFRTVVNYSGICISLNESMNDFLRKCEPPKHDNWRAENYVPIDEEKRVRAILEEISTWERYCINSLVSNNDVEKIDPIGMDKFLSYNFDMTDNKVDTNNSIMVFKPIKPELKKVEESSKLISGNRGNYGISDSYDSLNEKKKKTKKSTVDGDIELIVGNKKPKYRVPVYDIKTPYMNKKGCYIISFTSLETVKNCSLIIKMAIDDGLELLRNYKLEIYRNNEFERIENFDLVKDEKYIFKASFMNVDRVALEVSCYAQE